MTVHSLDLLGFEETDGRVDVRIDLVCGAGTYVRSIARDLGQRLGTGGHLRALRRTEAAGLRVEEAHTPERLRLLAEESRLGEAMLPVGALLPLPRVRLGSDAAWRFRHGAAQAMEDPGSGRVVVLGPDDALLGIGVLVGGTLRPDKVLVEVAP